MHLVPVRGTNTQHLRDGFTRALLQRMRDQDLTEDEEREIMKGIQEFKTNFPSGNVKKGTEFVFTKTSDGSLKMQHEVSFLKINNMTYVIFILPPHAYSNLNRFKIIG